jgi:hypothetical protein
VVFRPAFALACLLMFPVNASAQVFSQRGFVEARATLFPQDAPNDSTNAVGELLAREELFAKPAPWVQFAAGLDVRGNTHDQVERAWRPDFSDRTARRPVWSIRRLSATLHYRWLTVDAGRHHPLGQGGHRHADGPSTRDFLNVIDNEFLGVGVRGVLQAGGRP